MVGVQRGALDFCVQPSGPRRRTLKDRERRFRPVPHPLGFVAVHRRHARRQRREVETDHRQAVRGRPVAQDRHGELGAREVGLDEHRLGVAIEQEAHPLAQLPGRGAQVVAEHALAGTLRDRLHEHRERQPQALQVVGRLDARERRGGYAAIRQDFLGARLVEREPECERVGAGVRDVQILADGGDERFAALTAQSFRHVEHQIGSLEVELLWEEWVGFETDHAAEETESLLHRGDGGWVVPLGERVVGTRRLCRGVRGVRFFVVSETDAHVVSGDLLQKRPLVRSVNRKRVVA